MAARGKSEYLPASHLAHEDDPRAWEETDDFMLGQELLVASVATVEGSHGLRPAMVLNRAPENTGLRSKVTPGNARFSSKVTPGAQDLIRTWRPGNRI